MSFMCLATLTASGPQGWKYSEDSLWMNLAVGWTFRIASVARILALARCLMAVTKARSERRRSFHRPSWAEN